MTLYRLAYDDGEVLIDPAEVAAVTVDEVRLGHDNEPNPRGHTRVFDGDVYLRGGGSVRVRFYGSMYSDFKAALPLDPPEAHTP